jgi:hypothetical protein
LIRSLAVLKLWNSGGRGLDFGRLCDHIRDSGNYDIADLRNLLRKDQSPNLSGMIQRVVEGFQFLANLTELEKSLTADAAQRCVKEAEDLIMLSRSA